MGQPDRQHDSPHCFKSSSLKAIRRVISDRRSDSIRIARGTGSFSRKLSPSPDLGSVEALLAIGLVKHRDIECASPTVSGQIPHFGSRIVGRSIRTGRFTTHADLTATGYVLLPGLGSLARTSAAVPTTTADRSQETKGTTRNMNPTFASRYSKATPP